MTLKSTISFLIITLLLAACSTPSPTQPVVTGNPIVPTATSTPVTYPEPGLGTPVPTSSIYPAPGTPGTGTPVIPLSGYEPQPGDENLKRDKVTLDLANSQLAVTASDPAAAKAVLTGNMSDPCHFLRVVVTPPDANNTFNIDAYSLVDPNTACVTKIEPFTASIPLGSYAAGDYTVKLNGETLGVFATTFAPQPGDDKLTRADVLLVKVVPQLIESSTPPNEVSAKIKGSLPDPCHQLRIVFTPADSQNKINLEVYSVFDSTTACTKVIQPFQVNFPLGSFSSGHYSVYLNGELIGEFDG